MRRRWAALALALAGVGGCGTTDGGDHVGPDRARARLEQQREEVRVAAHELLLVAERALPGATANSVGGYEGCESAFNDEFRNFRYLAQARVDVDPASSAAAPFLADLRPALEGAGFSVGEVTHEPNGFVSLGATRGEVSAVFVHTGAGRFVGLDVAGDCVDVPEDDREYWLRRHEPTPEVR